MNAIFTVSISNVKNSQMYKCSLETIKYYAKKIGVDLIIQTKKKINHPQYVPHMEKFNLKEVLKKYERVLYLDNDIIITKNAPDIFKLYDDKNCVYMFNQAKIKSYNKSLSRIKELLNIDLDFWYKTGDRLSYFNTGVILVSRPNKDYFTIDKDYFNYVYEQGYINYKLMRNKVKIKELDTKFNHLIKFYKDKDGYILHYITGLADREKILVEDFQGLFKNKNNLGPFVKTIVRKI
jgi:lipopolysaccharide biosynthesis glycosyltransferase